MHNACKQSGSGSGSNASKACYDHAYLKLLAQDPQERALAQCMLAAKQEDADQHACQGIGLSRYLCSN